MAAICPTCQTVSSESADRCERCSSLIPGDPGPERLDLSTPMFDTDPHRQGIGGWLVLVAIGLIIGPALLANLAWRDFQTLTGPDHALLGLRLPGFPALLGFELVRNLALLGASLVLPVLFFKEKKIFPRLYQIWLAFSLAAALAEYTLSFSLSNSGSWEGAKVVIQNLHSKLAVNAAEYALSAVIWIAYFQVSQRVKATFVK